MTEKEALLQLYRPYLEEHEYNPAHLVTDTAEIQRILSGLVQSRELISVYLQGTDTFYLSAILGLDRAQKQVYLDISNQPGINRVMETGGKGLVIFAKPNDIRTLIYVDAPVMTTYKGMTVFSTSFPAHMIRLQRREYMRVSPSSADTLSCTIHVEHRTLSASIQDLSEGGLGLTTSNLPDGLKIGDIMPECYFFLPGEDKIEYDLKIKRITANKSDTPYTTFSLGCEYVNPSANANARLRQYIWQRERSNRAAEKS